MFETWCACMCVSYEVAPRQDSEDDSSGGVSSSLLHAVPHMFFV